MRQFLTLPVAALVFGLLADVAEARVLRPPQSARISDLWSANRGRVRVDARLRPTAGITYERSSAKSRRYDRTVERRSLFTSRYETPSPALQFYYPGTAEPTLGSRGVQTAPKLATMQPVKIRPPQVEPLPREHERWLSLRVPPPVPAASTPRPSREPSTEDGFFAPSSGGGEPSVAFREPAREAQKQAITPPPQPPPAPPATKTAKKESAPKPPPSKSSSAPKEGPGSSKASSEFDHLPYGVPVPGKAGYVTLGGAHSGLPEIDVRGIAPGTPVEIPDPGAPGATIQFRVP